MPEILLINPPGAPAIGPRYMHLGLAYLAAILKSDGFDVVILDAYLNDMGNDETLAMVQSFSDSPILVGFTLINEEAWKNAQTLCKTMKGAWPKTIFIAGGYFATFWFDEVLKFPELDLVVRGEGEMTILDIAHHIRRQQNIRGLPGTAMLVDGKALCAPPRPLIDNLDNLPFPYHPQASEILLLGGVPSIYSSRGCYNSCSFCQVSSLYHSQPGTYYRQRSVENVLAEIQQVQQKSHSDFILFTDDEFIGSHGAGRKRALELARAIHEQKPGVHFAFQCRADNVEESFFIQMENAGLRAVSVGIESLVPRSLKLFNKHIRVEQNIRAINILSELGIELNIGLILFDPYTTLDELAEHITLLLGLPVLPQSLNGLSVLRGTPLEHHFRQAGMLNLRGTYFEVSPIDPSVRAFQRLTHFYNALHREATNNILAASALLTAFPDISGGVKAELRSLQRDLRDIHRYFLSTSLGYLQKKEINISERIQEQVSAPLSILSKRAAVLYDRAQGYVTALIVERVH